MTRAGLSEPTAVAGMTASGAPPNRGTTMGGGPVTGTASWPGELLRESDGSCPTASIAVIFAVTAAAATAAAVGMAATPAGTIAALGGVQHCKTRQRDLLMNSKYIKLN